MAIQIIGILPPAEGAIGTPIQNQESISKHLLMDSFNWVDRSSQQRGNTKRELMYDWIVGKGGKAYIIRDVDQQMVYVFGAISDGKKYIRAAKDKIWTDDLIEIQKSKEAPPEPVV